jgi:hypothetical protein
MVRTVPVNAQKPMANPYAKKTASKTVAASKKAPKKKKVATWDNRWHQTASDNERRSKRVVTVSPNANPMAQVGGCFYYEGGAKKAGTIMPHPSNPTFFLPTQNPSSSDEDTDSEDEVVEVSRRVSLSPPLAQTQKESPLSSPEKVHIKKEKKAPITATITFHDDDFLEGIVQRVSENIGDLMLSYYASQTSSKNVSSV